MFDDDKPWGSNTKNFANAGYREAAIANEFPAAIKKTVTAVAGGGTVLIHKQGNFTRTTDVSVKVETIDELILQSPFTVNSVEYIGVENALQNPEWFPANIEPEAETFSYDGTEYIVQKKPACFHGALKNNKKFSVFFSSRTVPASDFAGWYNTSASPLKGYQFIESGFSVREYYSPTALYQPWAISSSGVLSESGFYIEKPWFVVRRIKSFSFNFESQTIVYSLSENPGVNYALRPARKMNVSASEGGTFSRGYASYGTKLEHLTLRNAANIPKIILEGAESEFFSLGYAPDPSPLLIAKDPPVSMNDYYGDNQSFCDNHLQETDGFGRVFHGLVRAQTSGLCVLTSDTGVGPEVITGLCKATTVAPDNLLYAFGLPIPTTPQIVMDKGGSFKNYSVLVPEGGRGRVSPLDKFSYKALFRDDIGRVFNVLVEVSITNVVLIPPANTKVKSCDVTINVDILGRNGNVGVNQDGTYETLSVLNVTQPVTIAELYQTISDPPFSFSGVSGWLRLNDLILEVYNTPNCRKLMVTVGAASTSKSLLVHRAILCTEISMSGTWPDLTTEAVNKHVSSSDSASVSVVATNSAPDGSGLTMHAVENTQSSITICYMPSEDNTFKRVRQITNRTVEKTRVGYFLNNVQTTVSGSSEVLIGETSHPTIFSGTTTYQITGGEFSYTNPDFYAYQRRGHLVMDLDTKMVGVDGGEFTFISGGSYGNGRNSFAYNPKTHAFATASSAAEIIYFT